MAIDPVCKMDVDEKSAPYHLKHDGQDFYFCARTCMEQFKEEPERYIEDIEAA